MTTIRHETLADIAVRERLLDAAFGCARYGKTAERLREGRLPAHGLSFVACEGEHVVGSVRLWDVSAGPARPALLLGPLVVGCESQRRGIGAALMHHALGEAKQRGHGAVLLVGDAPYYGRFGFSDQHTGGLWLPGPYERERLLACELRPDALSGAQGLIAATGRTQPRPAGATALLAHLTSRFRTATPHAA
jgi:predicted N-acetyltransferase YhbS